MSGTRKTVSEQSFLTLLDKHNTKFPHSFLNYSSREIKLYSLDTCFEKQFDSIIKAYQYLVNRYYYNKRGTKPRLGYIGNKNGLKR